MSATQSITPLGFAADSAENWWHFSPSKFLSATSTPLRQPDIIFFSESFFAISAFKILKYELGSASPIAHLRIMFSAKAFAALGLSALSALEFLFRWFFVHRLVNTTIWHKFQVFNPVVSLQSVFVMNHFLVSQRSPEVLRHHQSVLEDSSTAASVRMVPAINHDVALFSKKHFPKLT